MTDPVKKGLWLARTHYRMRMASFAIVFAASYLHLSGKGASAGTWAYLVGLLLVYPQVQYQVALRSRNPIDVAMRSLWLDAVLLGLYCAAVDFSDWLSFSVSLAVLSNNVANRDWRHTGWAMLGLIGGALIGWIAGGYQFAPQTLWPTALTCMVGLGAYVLEVGHITYGRNFQLRKTREQLRQRESELLRANSALQSNLLEIDRLRKGLADQANRDPLTNLFNRRYLDSTLDREMARCQREGKPLALVMIDIDHFKKFNDRYGHVAGDGCLKAVALALQGSAKRAGDLAARYGGEEFSLVLPDTELADALHLAESLREAVHTLAIAHALSPCGVVTISVGLAVMSGAAHSSADQLTHAADQALYYAKWGGRNRVQAAPEIPPGDPLDGVLNIRLTPLEWNPLHASGNAEIDAQHQELFVQINAVVASVVNGLQAVEVAAQMDNLIRNVADHFEAEERLLGAAGFEGLPGHAAAHGKLMERAVFLVNHYRNARLPIGDLLQFLMQDLIAAHVMVEDLSCFAPGAAEAV